MNHPDIPRQVKLPARIAVAVVARGIRIRLGRSLVTVVGVMCGIAFLMSVFTAQGLRRGVADEEQLRAAATRMLGGLEAEIGPTLGRTIAVLALERPNPTETRLVESLLRRPVAALRWHSPGAAVQPPPAAGRGQAKPEPVAPDMLAAGAAGIVVIGSPDRTAATAALARAAGPTPLAFTRPGSPARPAVVPDPTVIAAAQSATQIADAAKAASSARVRGIWILAISLVVTVMGIANAMLMAVTERFREIGTMKCLGALSGFVRQLFIIEAAFVGIVGGCCGVIGGTLFSLAAYSFTYGAPLVLEAAAHNLAGLLMAGAAALVAGLLLTALAAIYPAEVAARMVPADALRSNV